MKKRLLILGCGLAACLAAFVLLRRSDRIVAIPLTGALPADGGLHRVFEIRRKHGGSLSAVHLRADQPDVRLLQDGSAAVLVWIQAPVNPGPALRHIYWRQQKLALSIKFVLDAADSFADGTPDFLRLRTEEDRQSFRRRFAALAEEQAELPASQLPPEIDDCAALLRYCYREALRAHDERWLDAQHSADAAPLAAIRQYRYPETPLGAALFRVKPGAFVAEDLHDGAFAQFADAKTLMQQNTHFISRDIHTAQPGDLIFFRQLLQASPYHSMVVTRGRVEWVIYHTGPIGKKKGEMRRVAIDDLLRHPDLRWRPLPQNSDFLGVYRWNILRDGK